MKRYFKVYICLLKLNFNALLAYRANFYNNILSSLAWGIFTFISMILLTARVTSVSGWSRYEILLLTAVYSIFIGLFHTFFSRNFEHVAKAIRFGEVDLLLVKPIDTQWLLSVSQVNFASFTRVIAAIFFVGYLHQYTDIHITVLSVLFTLMGLLIGLLTVYSIWYIVVTLTIWSNDLSNLVEVLYSLTSIGRYPTSMVRNALGYAFVLILPLSLVAVVPTKILLRTVTAADGLSLMFSSVLLFLVSRLFWFRSLRMYAGMGS